MLFPLAASVFLLVGLLLDVVYFILPYILFVLAGWLLLNYKKDIWASENQEAT
jgi:hypothetical protein